MVKSRTSNVILDILSEEWRELAECPKYDPEWWFPLSSHDPCIQIAIAICATCPVSSDCETASRSERWGIWAGRLKEKPRKEPSVGTRVVVASRRRESVAMREARRAAAAEVVVELYTVGCSIRQCAEAAGVGETMARTILTTAGIPIRHSRPLAGRRLVDGSTSRQVGSSHA